MGELQTQGGQDKGKPYRVIGIARHSETREELVVYKCLYENEPGKLWVRPKAMFAEEIEVDGKRVPRFKLNPSP